MTPLLEVKNLKVHFPVKKGVFARTTGQVHAVDDVSFELEAGETLGIVGESGCGKTTTGMAILRLLDPTASEVWYRGHNLLGMSREAMRTLRRDRIAFLLEKVGMSQEQAQRYPHEFSGGQRQRIGIARALALNPKLIICDEPVSALDVSIQAQIINLLIDIQKEFAISYVIIAHDLAVVEYLCDRIAVMYLGKIVEMAGYADLFSRPRHPYTRALLSAVPMADPHAGRHRTVLQGDVPSPINPPPGCRFNPRCPQATEICRTQPPQLREIAPGHQVSCHFD